MLNYAFYLYFYAFCRLFFWLFNLNFLLSNCKTIKKLKNKPQKPQIMMSKLKQKSKKSSERLDKNQEKCHLNEFLGYS